MCIVVDTNSLALVFNTSCCGHEDFAPAREWIMSGPGCLVYGGTKYKKELSKAYRYLRLVRRLKEQYRAFEIDRVQVDRRELEVIDLTADTNCNDQHIIAILGVSGCLLVCSSDSSSYDFIKDRHLYPRGMLRPRIYTSAKNAALLCDKFLVRLRHVI